MGDIIELQDPILSYEERYLRAAVLTLSVNTVIGSIGLTIVEHVNASPGTKFSSIDWQEDLIRTGLPVIEKLANRDTSLSCTTIYKGQTLRLFIESAGVSTDGSLSFSDMFFAVGSHNCLGMSFSKQSWNLFRHFMSTIPRSMRIIEVKDRDNDFVFNFPSLIKVAFND